MLVGPLSDGAPSTVELHSSSGGPEYLLGFRSRGEKREVEKAAAMCGKSLNQFILDSLVVAARQVSVDADVLARLRMRD